MCSHRTQKHARDSLWGLLNPYVKPHLTKEEVKEFMGSLAEISTVLPWEYYQGLDTKRDMSVYSFLETCQDQAKQLVMTTTAKLEAEVTRDEFDKVFDAHWHNGFMIRHLIY